MIITQERIYSDEDASFSILFIDGVFECFVIEDEFREHKVPKETRIPAGNYEVGVKTYGGFHARYLRKFPDFHVGMLLLLEVPNFTDILLHVGNYEFNTDGCLLINSGVLVMREKVEGQGSVVAYKKFYRKVIKAALRDDLKIKIIDRDQTT